jgi:hypothetical protein
MAVFVLIAVKVKGKVICMSKYLTVRMHREHGVESMGERMHFTYVFVFYLRN